MPLCVLSSPPKPNTLIQTHNARGLSHEDHVKTIWLQSAASNAARMASSTTKTTTTEAVSSKSPQPWLCQDPPWPQPPCGNTTSGDWGLNYCGMSATAHNMTTESREANHSIHRHNSNLIHWPNLAISFWVHQTKNSSLLNPYGDTWPHWTFLNHFAGVILSAWLAGTIKQWWKKYPTVILEKK